MVDVQDVVVDGNATSPLYHYISKVPGVVSGKKVAVLHYDTEKSAWEVVKKRLATERSRLHSIPYDRLRLS